MKNPESLESIVVSVIEPNAADTDRMGVFPRKAMTALGEDGWLGLLSAAEMGGRGGTLAEACAVVGRIAEACASTAMVLTMHYCATVAIERHGSPAWRREIAEGRHLSTLAFSEPGSRSHFWAPSSTAVAAGGAILLSGTKTMVTSAAEADSCIWSSRPVSAEAECSLWRVSRSAPGLASPKSFDGLGLRGNASAPMAAAEVRVAAEDRLGADGEGFAIMMDTVLPVFSVLSAACSLGLMESALRTACSHVGGTRFQYLGSSLADLPTIRAYLARARIRTDSVKVLLADALAAIEGKREDALLRVLEIKAAAAEAALEVTDTAMRVCGGAAFRKELAIERQFRDARAAAVMAPTSDLLFDFIGKAVCGLPLF